MFLLSSQESLELMYLLRSQNSKDWRTHPDSDYDGFGFAFTLHLLRYNLLRFALGNGALHRIQHALLMNFLKSSVKDRHQPPFGWAYNRF